MKSSLRWLALPLAAVITACAADTEEDDLALDDSMDSPAAEVPMTPPAEPMASTMSETAQFQALGGSSVAGEATITSRENQTEVMVRLTGAPADVTLPGHIHSGTCESPGAVVQPLDEISIDETGAGEATSTVDVAPMTAMDGQHIVVYHDEGGTPIACAPIPGHAM